MSSTRIKLILINSIFIFLLFQAAHADDMVHEFKSPSFNGVNTSSHYLTIENLEHGRAEDIQAELEAIQKEIEREADNTVEARFLRNLSSRIYSSLASQIQNSLFSEGGENDSGLLELLGNTIEYEITDEEVKVKITTEDGETTEIIVPINGFYF